jgi:hypothetical protein
MVDPLSWTASTPAPGILNGIVASDGQRMKGAVKRSGK